VGRPKRRWEGNIKVDINEIGCGAWTVCIWLRTETSGGLTEHVNEPSDSIKTVNFLTR